jgi:hypothetical protein
MLQPKAPVEKVDPADAIETELTSIITPLMSGQPFDMNTKVTMLQSLFNARLKHQMTQPGRVALARVSVMVEQTAMRYRGQERWQETLAACEAFETLRPGSIYLRPMKSEAEVHVKRPTVHVEGFLGDIEREDVYAFLRVTDPITGKVENVQARPGQEFCGLRFDKIIGRQKGVRLEYLAIPGEFFDVLK